MADLAGRIPLVVDGGPAGVGLESTVLDGLRDPPAVLRPGGVTREVIASYPGLSHCGVRPTGWVTRILHRLGQWLNRACTPHRVLAVVSHILSACTPLGQAPSANPCIHNVTDTPHLVPTIICAGMQLSCRTPHMHIYLACMPRAGR
jgi:hypothetical protein